MRSGAERAVLSSTIERSTEIASSQWRPSPFKFLTGMYRCIPLLILRAGACLVAYMEKIAKPIKPMNKHPAMGERRARLKNQQREKSARCGPIKLRFTLAERGIRTAAAD